MKTNVRCRQLRHQGEDETHPPIPPAKKATGESMEPPDVDMSRRGTSYATTMTDRDEATTRESRERPR
jgi:hypothetical protein